MQSLELVLAHVLRKSAIWFGPSSLAVRLIKKAGTMALLVELLVLVGLAPAVPIAANSGPIGMVADNAGFVHVFDAGTNTVLGTVFIPNQATIGDCSISNDGKLGFVTNFLKQLYVIDLTSSPPILAPGINPITISTDSEDTSITPDGQYIVVADGGYHEPISVVSIATRTEISTKALGADQNSVEVLSDSSVLVTSFELNKVWRLTINGAGTLATTGDELSFTSPDNVYGSPDSKAGFVLGRGGNRVVTSFRIPGLTAVDTRSIPGDGVCGVMHPSGDKIYVRTDNGVVVSYSFNSSTGSLGALPLFSIPVAVCDPFFGTDQMTITPDGSRLYVPENNSLNVYDANTGDKLNTISDPNFSDLTGVRFTSSAINPGADLAVTKTDNPDPVIAGNDLTYAITVTNSGPSNATGVSANDTLPSGVTFKSANTHGKGTYNSGTGIWTVGGLINGESVIMTLAVTVKSSTPTGSITNTATVNGEQTDPDMTNNTATATTLIQALPSVPGVSPWGGVWLVLFFGITIVWLIRRRQIRSEIT